MRELFKVSEVFDLQMGKTPSRDNLDYWNNGDHEWVSIKDLGSYGKYVGGTKETISALGVKESGIKAAPANTLIMSFKLSLGKTAITTKQTYTNEAIMAFVDRGLIAIDLDYMYHQLSSKDWSAGTNTAVMGKTLNKKTLGASTIRIPKLSVQRRIANELDSIQSQIDATKQHLAMFDDLVKSRFIEMFGDPIENPMAWETKSIGQLYEVGSAKRVYARDQVAEGVPFLRLGDLTSRIQHGIESCELHISEELFSSYRDAGLVPIAGDVLVTARGTMGLCYVVKPSDRFYFQDGMITWLHIKPESPLPVFLTSLFSNEHFGEDLRSRTSGTTVKYLSIKTLSELPMIVPPLVLQQEFEAFVQQVDKSKFAVQQSIDKLQMLYDSLAQEYFGG